MADRITDRSIVLESRDCRQPRGGRKSHSMTGNPSTRSDSPGPGRRCRLDSRVDVIVAVMVMIILRVCRARREVAVGLRPGAAGCNKEESQTNEAEGDPRHGWDSF